MKFDTGFMGSTIRPWIKLALVEKSFLLNPISSIVKSIVARFASINTTVERVASNIFSKKLIQLLLRRGRNRGTLDWVKDGLTKDIKKFALVENVSENIGSLWRTFLEESSKRTKLSIIKMEISLIIGL